jgi:hypothetical protein
MWSSRVVARSIAKMRLQGGNRSSNAKVSAAGIRLDSRKIYRAFNGIICDDISEFESYMASQAVPFSALRPGHRAAVARANLRKRFL